MAETQNITDFDYTFVNAIARIAAYDDLKSAPRITKIQPAPTDDYIENLTTAIYEQSKLAGGKIPYSVIREVSENFIHAQFKEIVVSILDDGNTIRFADQGPGIHEKDKATQPGFSSAIEPMKDYIRGVGSGFPIVKDYLDDREGSIVIEDNLISGAVVTISLAAKPASQAAALQQQGSMQAGQHQPAFSQAGQQQAPANVAFIPRIPLSEREQTFMTLLLHEGDLGVTELHNLTDIPVSTVHATLRKLEEAGLVAPSAGKKRSLTEIGHQVAVTL